MVNSIFVGTDPNLGPNEIMGWIWNNMVGDGATPGSGAMTDSGIEVNIQGAPWAVVAVVGNIITSVGAGSGPISAGLEIFAGGGGGGTPMLHVDVLSNQIVGNDPMLPPLTLSSDAGADLCTNVRENLAIGGGVAPDIMAIQNGASVFSLESDLPFTGPQNQLLNTNMTLGNVMVAGVVTQVPVETCVSLGPPF